MRKLRSFLIQHEGYRESAYKDTVGKWTVFYGRNISDVPFSTEEALSLLQDTRKETAELCLFNDMEIAKKYCKMLFSYFDYWSENRQIAIISVMFNLGLPKFKEFRRMIAACRTNRWKDAHDELLDSKRARQLVKRSKEEAELLRDE